MASSQMYVYFDVANGRLYKLLTSCKMRQAADPKAEGCMWKREDFDQEWFDHMLHLETNHLEIYMKKLLKKVWD